MRRVFLRVEATTPTPSKGMHTRTIPILDVSASDEKACRDLASRSIEPNPSYEFDFLVPACRYLRNDKNLMRLAAAEGGRFACLPVRSASCPPESPLYSLEVGGARIAMQTSVCAGQAMFLWKIAYDEQFSRYSPGTQLQLQLQFLGLARAHGVEFIDACADVRRTHYLRLSPDRRRIATHAIGRRRRTDRPLVTLGIDLVNASGTQIIAEKSSLQVGGWRRQRAAATVTVPRRTRSRPPTAGCDGLSPTGQARPSRCRAENS